MSLKSTHASSLNLTAFFFFDKDIKVNDYLDYDSIKQYIKQLEMRFFFFKKSLSKPQLPLGHFNMYIFQKC